MTEASTKKTTAAKKSATKTANTKAAKSSSREDVEAKHGTYVATEMRNGTNPSELAKEINAGDESTTGGKLHVTAKDLKDWYGPAE